MLDVPARQGGYIAEHKKLKVESKTSTIPKSLLSLFWHNLGGGE